MSSLRRKRPHVCLVQNYETVRDERGNRVDRKVGDLVRVPVTMQNAREWSSAEELLGAGLQLYSLRVCYATEWPGDAKSRVFWDGYEYETVGDPSHNVISRRTSHWQVILRRIGTDKEGVSLGKAV